MVGLALFGAMIFYLELEVVFALPVKAVKRNPYPRLLVRQLIR
jgi:hypothetical protein